MMQYFVLALLFSTLIIGDVAGETRRETLALMLNSGKSSEHSAVKRQIYKCTYRPPRPPIYKCVYHPSPRRPSGPIRV